MSNLPINFFTIVLNGQPFIEKHLKTFLDLDLAWHWHVIEGVAELRFDTSWSLANGGKIPSDFHRNGLSIDGTTEYLDQIAAEHPSKITIYRKPSGVFWDGKREMVNAPLSSIKNECLLWQIDADEFWTVEQIKIAHNMFENNPKKFAAYYWCYYFVGPDIVITTRNGYANNPSFEWERTWRYLPHFRWAAHEPPLLVEKTYSGTMRAVRDRGVFAHDETEKNGLVFHHYAYVNSRQLNFKESYYGYKNALAKWRQLQQCKLFPVNLRDYFDWVGDNTSVDLASAQGLFPIFPILDSD